MLIFQKELGPKYAARLQDEYATKIDPKLRDAIDYLAQWVHDQFCKDLVVTCLIRTQAENYKDNGRPASAHLTGRAVDFRTVGVFTEAEVKQIVAHVIEKWGPVMCVVYHNAGSGQHLHLNVNYAFATKPPATA